MSDTCIQCEQPRPKKNASFCGRRCAALNYHASLSNEARSCRGINIGKAQIGMVRGPLSPEHREKIKQSHIGHPVTSETRAKLSAANVNNQYSKGVKRSDAYKAKMREIALGRPPKSVEVRAKHSKAHNKQAGKQSKPEALLQRLLDGNTWKFVGAPKLNDGSINHDHGQYDIPVSADFVDPERRILLFEDGCYWHNCQECGFNYFPQRPLVDAEIDKIAQAAGWVVIRIWQHELGDPNTVLAKIERRR